MSGLDRLGGAGTSWRGKEGWTLWGKAGTEWLGGVCSGIVWYGWQVRRDKVGHGEVRQVGLGGARWS